MVSTTAAYAWFNHSRYPHLTLRERIRWHFFPDLQPIGYYADCTSSIAAWDAEEDDMYVNQVLGKSSE